MNRRAAYSVFKVREEMSLDLLTNPTWRKNGHRDVNFEKIFKKIFEQIKKAQPLPIKEKTGLRPAFDIYILMVVPIAILAVSSKTSAAVNPNNTR